MKPLRALLLAACALLVVALCPNLFATATIAPYYAGSYTLVDLGPAGAIPNPYGGLNIVAGDYNTLLLGGTANQAGGLFYEVPVTRGPATTSPDSASPPCSAPRDPITTAVWPTVPGASCSTRNTL